MQDGCIAKRYFGSCEMGSDLLCASTEVNLYAGTEVKGRDVRAAIFEV